MNNNNIRRRAENSAWQRFCRFVYNPTTGEFFGRNATRWFQLSIFYAAFYACLSLVFGISIFVLNTTLNEKAPKQQLAESLIGTNPGMGFRPMSPIIEDGFLIKYDIRNESAWKIWTQILEQFLEPYRKQHATNLKNCTSSINEDQITPQDNNHICFVNIDFGPCSSENFFGYKSDSPCVFVKLNKIYGWVPKFYKRYQKGMPKDLVIYIENLPIKDRNNIWVSCNGEKQNDEKLYKSLKYYPNYALPGYHYPYLNLDNYLSPLIAVQIIGLNPNVTVNIECRAWAKNIYYKGGESREGSVRFEIQYIN